MKRNRQHIIEEESEVILRSLFPSEWVIRKLPIDYGIDFDIEIFEDGNSTGLHFFLQLKDTDKIDKSKHRHPLINNSGNGHRYSFFL